ncbi:MAG: MBL fold metallo-hydrolase [Anaerolineaceae bacterium]|nr:MAG: MBL fold metallo-hydrolase [Anaerolineaceae bacterium]
MDDKFAIRFWGVRGSYPAPGNATVRYGGNTPCVEVTAGGRTLILDAGTGVIPLGRDLVRRASGKPLEVLLLVSHLHHDHTQGFPFFTPAYIPSTRLHVYGLGADAESLERVLESNQSAQRFPVSLREMGAAKDIRSLRESDEVVWDEDGVRVAAPAQSVGRDALRVRIHRSYAHPGGVYVYRVEWRGRSLVYATDTEGYVGGDRRLAAFARGADVLIHDAQYSEAHYRGQTGAASTQGFGHSTVEMACEAASAAGVGRLVLFHHDPSYGDAQLDELQARARSLFPNSQMAYEGLTLELNELQVRRILDDFVAPRISSQSPS